MVAEPNEPAVRIAADVIHKWCDGDAGRPIISRDQAIMLARAIMATFDCVQSMLREFVAEGKV